MSHPENKAQGCGSCSGEQNDGAKRVDIFEEIAKITDHLNNLGEEEVQRILDETLTD